MTQTEGKELPAPIYDLKKGVENYQELLLSLLHISEASVRFDELSRGTNGYYSPEKKEIVLQTGMTESMTIKTLIHELTHSELHTNSQARFGDEKYQKQEFEAESVAYVICQKYGVDSSDYSFGYLANWGMQKLTIGDLKTTLSTVQKEAHSLIQKIDQELEKTMSKKTPEWSLENAAKEAQEKIKNQTLEKTNKAVGKMTNFPQAEISARH